MNRSAVIALLLFSSVSAAYQEDVPITSASQLREWCKAESHAFFTGRGDKPYNWSASYWEEADTLRVNGNWRLNSYTAVVECRTPRGAQTRYAVMSVQDPRH